MIIEVSFDGMSRAVSAISALAGSDHAKLMRMLGVKVQQQTVRHFNIGAGPDGPWAPTQRGGQILVDTGRLRGSIQYSLHGNSVSVGTNVHYGKYHQHGTRRMPARPFIGLTQADKDELMVVIVNHVRQLVAA